MGQLSAAMKAELQGQAPATYRVLKLEIAGTDYLFGQIGGMFGSSPGIIEPLVLSFGSHVRGISLGQHSLELVSRTVRLADTNQTLTQLIEGVDGNEIRGSTATIYLASPNVSSGDWFTLFVGEVDTVSQPDKLMWDIALLSARDQPLRRKSIPKHKITRADWPNASIDVIDQPVPIIYGRKSSANDSNTGAVPTLYVDTSGFRYLVCGAWAKDVDKVYSDGALVAAADYSITHPLVNGRRYTLIDFTDDQGDAVVTCDAYGYEEDADGTGALIEDPLTVLKHVLVNWVWGDYKAGAWFSDSTAPVDTTSFGSTFFSDRGYGAPGFYVAEKQAGLDVINRFLESYGLYAWWTAGGKLAAGVQDFTSASYPDLVLHEEDVSGYVLERPSDQIVDAVEAQYGFDPAAGTYRQYLNVRDLGTGEEAPEPIDILYSPAFII